MSSLVIVAIPEEQDRVWKISSEQVPHLTLLYLGDVDQVQNLDQIVQFVEHAVTLSEHGPMYLDVERRGTLGDAEADVLFFNRRSWNLKWIRQFRGQLLQNQSVRTAFDSTDQILEAPQEWTPHLTLGYPETPAKADPNDEPFGHPLYSVCFDRIAVWPEEYDGPEFQLEWPEREFDGDLAIAYSDEQKRALTHYARQEGVSEAEFLEHHGVKGMKWGVRRERNAALAKDAGTKIKSGAKAVGRTLSKVADALGEHFYETSIYSSVTHERIHNQVADEIDSKIYRLQNAPKYRGKSLKADKALETEYHQDVAKVTDSAYRRAVKDQIGENTRHTKEARYVDDARGPRIEIRNKQTGEKLREADLTPEHEIQTNRLDETLGSAGSAGSGTSRFRHAATDPVEEPDITIPLKLDADGKVKAVGRVQPEGTTIDHGEAFVEGLIHYGVKGMKWGVTRTTPSGVRRGTPVPVAPQATSKVPHGKKRKTKIKTDGGENHPASEDAIKVAEAHAKLKKSGPAALSNKELQELQTRLNLENSVAQLTKKRSTIGKGRDFVKNLTSFGKETNDALNTSFQTAKLAKQVKKK